MCGFEGLFDFKFVPTGLANRATGALNKTRETQLVLLLWGGGEGLPLEACAFYLCFSYGLIQCAEPSSSTKI